MKAKSANRSKTSASQQVVREAVSSKLKVFYDDISRQEVPQRFLDLLQDLDKAHEPSE
jgi:Anti-sigma factor NepR